MELLSILVFDACNTFTTVFIACELCQRMRDAFDEISDLIDRFHWYRFPSKMKRNLRTALIIAQKPVSVECFGSFSCCRESLKNVKMKSNNFIPIHAFFNCFVPFSQDFGKHLLIFYDAP